MQHLCFILNTSLLDISALNQHKHLDTEQSEYHQAFAKIPQAGIPANNCSSQVLRYSTHGNLTTLNYKKQSNAFETHVIKTQNNCIYVSNKKAMTKSFLSNHFAYCLSRSCKRTKQEPDPRIHDHSPKSPYLQSHRCHKIWKSLSGQRPAKQMSEFTFARFIFARYTMTIVGFIPQKCKPQLAPHDTQIQKSLH